ncbi:hypothetical protein AB205_0013100 [Aquarana catesbeiana]|uniref:Uncharacterized protein n=1 Tax=Aquarana catesbeiana TaxID=8400 RepID=A0A2G9RZY6_AQUCT|nr:hypothetical protein AB205_0013100 [Aquarana catesbeiana]
MASERLVCKVGLWVLAACMVLSLQGAEAQTNSTNTGVPGWGIALLVLTSLILASMLCSLCCVPLLCKSGGDSHCGFSLSK